MDVRFRDVLAFAFGQWRQRPITVAVAAALMFGGTMAEIFTPVAIGWLVDALGSARPDPDAAVRAFAAVLCLGILFQLLQKSGDYVWAGLEVGIMRRIGADAFASVQRYSSDWHADTFAGPPCATSRAGFGRSTCSATPSTSISARPWRSRSAPWR